MNWQSFGNGLFGKKIKIIHRIPGRLRLSVTALNHLAKAYSQYVPELEKLMTQLPGMFDVSMNQGSDSVLLEYDDATVTESEVIGWMERLSMIAIEKYHEHEPGGNIHTTLLHIQAALQDEISVIGNGDGDR
jgi:hypothetical protein